MRVAPLAPIHSPVRQEAAETRGPGKCRAGAAGLRRTRAGEMSTFDQSGNPYNSTERRIVELKRRLVREATGAIGMLEHALEALWKLDAEQARSVRLRDDNIDQEEVDIERECYNLLSLHHPFAHDFRVVTFILKVNADVERVADHACSVAKSVMRIHRLRDGKGVPQWPTALVDLGHRVPQLCHDLMGGVLDENVETARRILKGDEVIDQLEKQLFQEITAMVHGESATEEAVAMGMLTYRVGRELERIGDLMKDVAEEVVYLKTGSIIRHEKRRPAAT
jgi:phosphate transport system protein